MDDLNVRFKNLRMRLREELINHGHTVTQYFESLDGKPLCAHFNNEGSTLVVHWGRHDDRRKMYNPNPVTLAEEMIEYIEGSTPLPKPQKPKSQLPPLPTAKPIAKKPVEYVSGMFLTDAEYKEYKKLKAMSEHGIWMSKEAYASMQEEMRIGYINQEMRVNILARMDRFIRSLS